MAKYNEEKNKKYPDLNGISTIWWAIQATQPVGIYIPVAKPPESKKWVMLLNLDFFYTWKVNKDDVNGLVP